MIRTFTFDEWKQSLRETLGRLYDPAYQPAQVLWLLLSLDPSHDRGPVWSALARAIESLQAGPEVPPNARARRIYQVLSCRYLQQMTQEETALRLNITSRHLRREQQEAVHALALWLWERNPQAHLLVSPPDESAASGQVSYGEAASAVGAPAGDAVSTGAAAPERDTSSTGGAAQEQHAEPEDGEARSVDAAAGGPMPAGGSEASEGSAWRAQVTEELASLDKSAPGSAADVVEELRGAVALLQVLAARHQIELTLRLSEPALLAAMHPSALRQALVTSISTLLKHLRPGRLEVSAEYVGPQVVITLTGPAGPDQVLPGSDLIQQILASYGGSAILSSASGPAGPVLTCVVQVPRSDLATVLLIDDNQDLAHFFQRFTAATRFQIVHVAQGRQALEAASSLRPDVIVLDVMLADIDGWEVLTHLHEHPATRAIPVIICSVSREEELALALGATSYLAKPARRTQFILALEKALALRGRGPGPPSKAGVA